MRGGRLAVDSQVRAVVTALFWSWLIASIETSIVFRLPPLVSSLNLPLVATLAAVLFVSPEYGVGFAFVSGLFCDLAIGSSVGVRSISLVLCAAVVGVAQDRFFREHPVTWALLGLVGSLLHDLVCAAILKLVGRLPVTYLDSVRIAAVGALLNSIFSFVCLWLVYLRWKASAKSFPDGLE